MAEDKIVEEIISEEVIEDQTSSSEGPTMSDRFRENPWILSTLILGVLTIALFVIQFNGGIVGNVSGSGSGEVLSGEDAGAVLVEYLNKIVPEGEVTFVSAEEEGNMYLVTVDYQDQDVPVYVTKDGAYYTSNLIPITDEVPTSGATTEPVEIPQNDLPIVDLFIWSYCPYGVQAQAPLADVANLLGDDAVFNAVLYHDGHGAFETQQNKIQACIQKYDKENYWNYAKRFVEEIYPVCGSSRDIECDLNESILLMDDLGIDSEMILECVETEGEDLITADREYAQSLGVSGSPTLVVNGVIASPASRTAESFKSTVCEGFNNAPEVCATELDSTAEAAAGNC